MNKFAVVSPVKWKGREPNAVKTVKRIMKKSLKSGEDPFLALLSWRNTPAEGMNSSPVSHYRI
jgi:hypothetical protein